MCAYTCKVNGICYNYVPGFIVAAADVNGDGKINVTDIMGIANIILQPNNANNAPMLQDELMLQEPDKVYNNPK